MKRDLEQTGSKTAKDGFKNERDVVDKFNNWKNDYDSQAWLKAMNYNISEIEKVEALIKAIEEEKTTLKNQMDSFKDEINLLKSALEFKEEEKQNYSHYS
mgnify:CR=1 FL=1